MRGCALVAVFLATAVRVADGHPLCYVDERPTDYNQVLNFCPEAQAGACCTDLEEAEVEARFDAAGPLTGDCEDLYKQVCVLCFVWYLISSKTLVSNLLLRSSCLQVHSRRVSERCESFSDGVRKCARLTLSHPYSNTKSGSESRALQGAVLTKVQGRDEMLPTASGRGERCSQQLVLLLLHCRWALGVRPVSSLPLIYLSPSIRLVAGQGRSLYSCRG